MRHALCCALVGENLRLKNLCTLRLGAKSSYAKASEDPPEALAKGETLLKPFC